MIHRFIGIGMAVLISAAALTGCSRQEVPVQALRLGWQPPWANQGQIVEVLMHSDVLKQHGVRVNYRAFSYGGPMREAALAGELDLLFVGNQPAITLISRDDSWRIVARLTSYRSAIVVPNDSPLHSLADLKGRTLATAFGSTTHRDTVLRLQDAGVSVGKDVTLVNLDQAEHAAVIARGGTAKWGNLDAIATYDPTVAVALNSGQARILAEWPSPAVVVARRTLIEQRFDDLKNFLAAYAEAYSIYANSPAEFDQFYEVDSRLPLPATVYRTMAGYETNLAATNPSSVNISLDEQALQSLERDTKTAFEIGIIKKQLEIRQFVDLRAVK